MRNLEHIHAFDLNYVNSRLINNNIMHILYEIIRFLFASLVSEPAVG